MISPNGDPALPEGYYSDVEDIEGESLPSRNSRQARNKLVIACAIAHGEGAGMSKAALIDLVLERGLPSRTERERMRLERLSEQGDNAEED